MTKFLALVSGFCLTLLIFAGGAFTTLAFVTAEPTEVLKPTTSVAVASADEVIAIKKGQEETEDSTDIAEAERNAPGHAASPAVQLASEDDAPAEPSVDQMTTAALTEDTASPAPRDEQDTQLGADHIAWCSQHYRSYDPADNHYNAYSGERRQCVSPFSDAEESGSIIQASNEGSSGGVIGAAQADRMPKAAMDWQHVQDCFARYRSYRPEDNSYQPYGGGPRQQCE